MTWRRVGALTLLGGVIAIGFTTVLPARQLSPRDGGARDQRLGAIQRSQDLLSFVTPSSENPVLPDLDVFRDGTDRAASRTDWPYATLAYPGVVALVLAAIGLIVQRETAWAWGALAAVTFLLSLGPVLKVGGEHFPLVPMVDVGPTPDHMVDALMLSLAILTSYGAAAIFSGKIRQSSSLILWLISLSLVVGIESIPVWPFPTSSSEIPDTIRVICLDGNEGALFYAGMDGKSVNDRALYYQTALPRPVVGGRVHASSALRTSWSRTVLSLVESQRHGHDIVPLPTPEERVSQLRQLNVDYVLGSTEDLGELTAGDAIEPLLEAVGRTSDDMLVFRVPPTATGTRTGYAYSLVHETWHPPERDGGTWKRRLRDEREGLLHVYAPLDERGSLQIDVESTLEAPILEAYLDDGSGGRRLDSFIISGRVTCNTRIFTLTQGMNTFQLRAPEEYREGPTDPSLTEAFAFRRIRFVPASGLPAGRGIDMAFGNPLRLRGWSLSAPPSGREEQLRVTLQWEKVGEVDHRHVGFVHLISGQGDLVDQHDSPLVERQALATEWPAGTIRTYRAGLKLPKDWQTSDYYVLVGVYLWPELERLPVEGNGPGSEIDVLRVPLRLAR